MSATVSLFIVSLVGMSAILGSRKFLYRSEPKYLIRSDEKIREWLNKGGRFMRLLNRRTFGLLAHYLLEKIEYVVNRIFAALKRRVKK